MSSTVEALVATDTRGHFSRATIPRRDPGPHDVLIDIWYAGICHSDYHNVKAEWAGYYFYPMVPGHEIVGIVSKLGSDVSKFEVGDKVGVGCFVDSCRSCDMCAKGTEQYCKLQLSTYNAPVPPQVAELKNIPGNTTYGGYSEKIVVDENYVVNVPDSIPFEHAAPLLCAGITMYSPLCHLKARENGRSFNVGIIGLGGLGDMGVKISKAMGNQVTVISSSDRKREYAEKTLGVRFINSGRDAKSLRSMHKKYAESFDLILCTISANFDLNPYLHLVKPDGTFCIVGAPTKPLKLQSFLLLAGRRSITGSMIGGIKETQEMIDFCAEHQIWSEAELIEAKEVNRAFKELGNNTASKQRFVIDVKNSLVPGDWKVDMSHCSDSSNHYVNPSARIIGAENTAGKTYNPEQDAFVSTVSKM